MEYIKQFIYHIYKMYSNQETCKVGDELVYDNCFIINLEQQINEKKVIKFEHYNIHDFIMTTLCGCVVIATDTNKNKETVLKFWLKNITTNKATMRNEFIGGRWEQIKETPRNEAKLLKQLNHEHIIKSYNNGEKQYFGWMELEYAKYGDLMTHVTLYRQIDEDSALVILKKMLKVVNYLHKNNIVHLDISLENIYIYDSGSENKTVENVKLGDFGLAKEYNNNFSRLKQGKERYISPEVNANKHDEKKTDIWGLGVVFYIMLSGKVLINKASRQDINYMHIISGNIKIILNKLNGMISKKSMQLLELMLSFEDKRPTAQELLDLF
jgi:serine/threonine protein kinase